LPSSETKVLVVIISCWLPAKTKGIKLKINSKRKITFFKASVPLKINLDVLLRFSVY